MGYTLIIAEKPDAARRIAEALADKKPKVIRRNEVEFYEFTVNGKKHVCVPAVGHLFVLSPPKTNKGWSYPIFSYEWVPTYTKKGTEWTRKYFENIKDLVKGADEFIDAADVDTEGEVLLYNILRFICGVEDAKRIQFSTLTKDELVEAYRNMSSHILFPMLESGLTRHELDWLWGINLTRALTLALKSQAEKGFAILSAGRVQSPTLNLLLERELEIRKFKPKPFWQLELKGKVDNQEIIAMHEKDKFWKKEEVDKVLKNCEGKDAVVKDVKKREYKQKPPFPFNTTDLQAEAYSQFKFSPTQTLQIAESLYQMGAISYPRSSSQKIPSRIGYEKLLKALATLRLYEKFTNELLKKEKLIPHEGPREDPAHYAVIATWEPPDLSKLTPQQRKLYDLIVRRTLATFAEEALRESISAILAIDDNKFIASGKRTIKPGWTEIYSPYLAFEEQILPELKVGQSVKVIKINLLSKQTQPPPRYTQGSIIKEMEKRNLGTRCVTGDTKIPVLINHKMREVEIEKLFDENNSLNGGNEKILINSSNMCFCINDYNLTTSKFTLISRRKLEKDEKVFEITFEDGSKIKLTEEHPVLVYDKSNFVYVPTKNFSKEVTVCSSFHYEKFGKRINFKDFVKKLDSKSKIYGHIELKKWRNCKKITQKNFGKRMGVRQSTIANWEKKKLLPLWAWSKIDLPEPKVIYSVNKKIALKNPFPLTVSSSLIRIVSHLIGDGSLDRKKLKKENCFDFRYTNKNLDLVKLFVKDLEKNFKINKEFKIKTDKKDKNKFYVQIPAVIGRTLGILFKGLISKKVNIDKNFYPDFIGAIFDDEGHAYKNETKIFISNTNFSLVKNLEKYLKVLGLKPYVREENPKHRKRNWAKSYKIYLYGRDVAKFLELIPFFHKRKKERIIENLSKNYFYHGKPYLLLEKKVFASLPKDGATLKEIVLITGLSPNTIKTCLKNLRKYGYVGMKVIGISEAPRKKILYIPLKECYKTFYSLLGEKVISSTLFTKTVKNVREVNYDGYVYDITNLPLSNFILGNNVVVHNSTRAEILQTLYDRKYIFGKSIQVTKLGEIVAKTLRKFVPSIVSEELTRHFEKEMDQVFNGKKKKEKVVEEAKKVLSEILEEFKSKEDKIGKKLLEGLIISRKEERKIGICPNCGGELRIIFSRASGKRFVGCSNYPKCKTGFPLPSVGQITSLNKNCEVCGLPMIQVWRKGKRPFRMCINPKCKTKENWNKNKTKS